MSFYLERTIASVIRGEIVGWKGKALRPFLRVLSWVYGLFSIIRNWAYDKGYFRSFRSSVPVVSVGNIVAGGTGKTPLVRMLSKYLSESVSLAIVSRGYRSKAEKMESPVFLSRGKELFYSSAFCGDEPCLLARALPGVSVIVGRDRLKAVDMAEKGGASMAILDDGMQHRRLQRDVELVVVDMAVPLGYGSFLPYGLLRESPRALSRADMVFVNRVKDRKCFCAAKEKLRRYTEAPIVGTRVAADGLFDCKGNEIGISGGKKVGIFCGIADPHAFRETVKDLECDIVEELYFPDHIEASQEELLWFSKRCHASGAELLLCTEKDAIKLDRESVRFLALPLAYVKVSLELVEGEEHWEALLASLKALVVRRVTGRGG